MKRKKYRVRGNTSVTVTVEVFADSESEAFERASEELPGLECFAGNGDVDKMVGVSEENHCIAADDEITYDDIEELDPDEYDDEEVCDYE